MSSFDWMDICDFAVDGTGLGFAANERLLTVISAEHGLLPWLFEQRWP